MRTILVPIDGSELADKALNTALYIAGKTDADIEIMHVVPPTIIPFYPYPVIHRRVEYTPQWLNDYTKESKLESQKMLSEAVKTAESKSGDIQITSKLSEGRPADVIIAEAEDKDVDLIVMGSRGLGDIKGRVLGSVSNQVVQESKIPVYIVK
jgi:nucleotide-binding universal stress UspA family protein